MSMLQSSLVASITISGFIAAAIMDCGVVALTGSNARFEVSARRPMWSAAIFMFCMFAGPYLLLTKSLKFWREGYLPSLVFLACCFVSAVWSFCSGIFVLQALVMSKIVVV